MMGLRFNFSRLPPPPYEPIRRRALKKKRARPVRFVVPDKLAGSVALKEGQEVRAYLHYFGGAARLNLRLFVQKAGGEWIPTKAGFTVRIKLAAELGALLGRCVKEAPDFEAECSRLRSLGLAE